MDRTGNPLAFVVIVDPILSKRTFATLVVPRRSWALQSILQRSHLLVMEFVSKRRTLYEMVNAGFQSPSRSV